MYTAHVPAASTRVSSSYFYRFRVDIHQFLVFHHYLLAAMGLLSEGRPLSWPETKSKGWIVHKYGLEQFIAIYKRLKDRKGDTLKWGDEVPNVLMCTATNITKLSLPLSLLPPHFPSPSLSLSSSSLPPD